MDVAKLVNHVNMLSDFIVFAFDICFSLTSVITYQFIKNILTYLQHHHQCISAYLIYIGLKFDISPFKRTFQTSLQIVYHFGNYNHMLFFLFYCRNVILYTICVKFFFFYWEIKSAQGLTPTKATSLVGTTSTLAGKACTAC